MSGAHLHLLLNHFPIIGLIFSILLISLGLVRKNVGALRSGLLIAFVAGVLAVPTFLTGEPAEEVIEHQPDFSEAHVEEHEKAADFALWFTVATGAAAGVGLYFSVKQNRIPKPLLITIVVLNVFTLTVLARTNYLGGLISHPELRPPPVAP